MNSRHSSRRDFLAAGLSAAGAAASLGAAAPDDVPARPAEKTPRRAKYIDIHTHLGAFYHDRELTAAELVRFMDRHDIERAVVQPLVSPEAAPILQSTETALAAHRAYPDRLIPFCGVDPRGVTVPPQRTGHIHGVQGLVEILRRYIDAGCRGVGEHKTGLHFDAPQLMYLYEACAKVGLPILFHLDDLRNIDTPGLPRLERVLRSFPELSLIGHAAGFWASISGDATFADFGRYPKVPSPVQSGGALDRLLAKYPNLYGDLSEPGAEKAIARDLRFGREFLIRHADKLLFATDVLMPNQPIPQFELLDSLNLPADVQRKIYRGNAIKLLKLKPDE